MRSMQVAAVDNVGGARKGVHEMWVGAPCGAERQSDGDTLNGEL
jgi:hypothetical protein